MTHSSKRAFYKTTLSAAALSLLALPAMAQNFASNGTFQGSLCVGFDCSFSESFGVDTIRLKENNLRINFEDTSSAGSFPTNDWTIVANSSSNGGDSYLAFQDDDATNRLIFVVEAGAPANALRVEQDGDVGIGVESPVVDLHMRTGNTPTIRLDQDGSNGFAAQVWDLAANETNFFVRDVSNGSALPFRIRTGAPADALYVADDGDIGLGTASPSGTMHIFDGTSNVDIILEQNNGANAAKWVIRNNSATGRMTYRNDDTGLTPFKMGRTAVENLLRVGITSDTEVDINGTLVVSGTITSGGPTCGSGCDAVFDADYPLPSISAHNAETLRLGYLPNVGPTLPHAPFNVSEKMGGMLNELEHAHLFIAELNDRIAALEAKLAE